MSRDGELEMLWSMDSNEEIHGILHRRDYDRWRAGISDDDYREIFDELAQRIHGTEIQTSSWIPGEDWRGTVFQPIYEDACGQDPIAAAKFFGLILWDVMLHDEHYWSFGRYEKDGIPIGGLTYFQVQPNV